MADIEELIEKLREAENARSFIIATYDGDLRSEGAANSCALWLVHYGALIAEARAAMVRTHD